MARMSPGRIWCTWHDVEEAPGSGICPVCNRLVVRGKGRWWELRGQQLLDTLDLRA
jgi:hypothetical protein